MSDYMGDISSLSRYAGTMGAAAASRNQNASDAYGLDMQDFLTLMVTEMTHQSMDDTADTSEMLNQMVQMQMVQALTNMTDASIMSYAASLVGKEVTVGQFDADGKLQELVGVVSGTGTMGGSQVVFVNDKYYYMNEIMAVGRLPQEESAEEEGTDKVEGTDGTESGGQASDESAESEEVAPAEPEDVGI